MTDELQRIEDKIDVKFGDFQKFLTKLSNEITANSTEIENCKREKNSLTNKINGTNGTKGLLTRVGNLEIINKTTSRIKSGVLNNTLGIIIAVGVIVSIVLSLISFSIGEKRAVNFEEIGIEDRIEVLEKKFE